MRFMMVMVVFMIGGCATLSEQECRTVNWAGLGTADGQAGREPNRRLERHHNACAKLGIVPNRELYMVGWNQGIRDYCTPEQAYSMGRRGFPHESHCPGDTTRLFQINYQIGRRVYDLEGEIERVQQEIREQERKLGNRDLKPEERRTLLDRIRHRDGELSHLRHLLFEAQAMPVVRE